MRRARGVDDERLCVAHVRQVARELEAVDELRSRRGVALDAEAEHAAVLARHAEQLLRELVRGVRLEAEVGDPGDVRVLLEPAGERKRVLAMPLAAEGEGLEALEKEEGGEGAKARADIAE